METEAIVTARAERPHILITAPFSEGAAEELRRRFDVTVVPPSRAAGPLADRVPRSVLADANVAVAELEQVDDETLDLAPRLQLVVSCRANPVNVDLPACARRGIPVATTPGRNAEVTADFAFALLMATVRHLSAAERWLRAGNWSESDLFESYERFAGIGLRGRTLGILGGGAVGSRVVRPARAFGMAVKVYDPCVPADAFGTDAEVVELDDLLSTADIVTVHVPLSPDTEGLLGRRELALLKPEAYLINAGRAAIIDEDALREVLRERRIAGAGFDVFHREPLSPDDELMSMDNVTMTPHIAGASKDVVAEHSRMAVEAIAAWAEGRPIPGLASAPR